MTTHVLFVAGFLLLPLFGLATWRLEAVRRMDLGGRIAVAGAAGALVTAVVMALLSLVGVGWSRTVLFVILGVIAIVSFRAQRGIPGATGSRAPLGMTQLLIAAFAVLTCYGLLTARESAGDLHFFWGPKGIHFYHAGGIDVPFLANKANPNSDYPPLLPLLYAWSQTVARQFSWWGAVLATVLFLLGSVAILRSFSGDDDAAVLLAATLSYAIAFGFAAGGADPPLVFFETLALCALVFLDNAFLGDARSRDVLAAIGLAGAAMTKVEGATFVIAVVLALLIVRREFKRTLLIATPAILILVSWLVFLITNGLIFGYGGAKVAIHFSALPKTLALVAKASLYELYGIPWIVPLVLLFLGKPSRAILPLLVVVLTLCATIFFYIHLEEPSWWIAASAPRVLLTPLTALIVASAASVRLRGDAAG